jgi:hypothetical protein
VERGLQPPEVTGPDCPSSILERMRQPSGCRLGEKFVASEERFWLFNFRNPQDTKNCAPIIVEGTCGEF